MSPSKCYRYSAKSQHFDRTLPCKRAWDPRQWCRVMCMSVAVTTMTGIKSANATIIYADNFDGSSGNVTGRTPDTTSGLYGGTAGAIWGGDSTTSTNPDHLWTASGGTYTGVGSTGATVGTLGGGADSNLITNEYLPFTPQAGYVYDLHAAIYVSSVGASTNWLGLAYTLSGLNGHTTGGASSALSNDNPYGLILMKGSGAVQNFGGLGTANQGAGTTVTAGQINSVDILLDTTGPTYEVSWLVNGVSLGSPVSIGTPAIGDVVFGTNKLDGAVSDFSLTTPEPTSLGLGAIAASYGLVRRRRPAAILDSLV